MGLAAVFEGMMINILALDGTGFGVICLGDEALLDTEYGVYFIGRTAATSPHIMPAF
jgi:hypothetical protein